MTRRRLSGARASLSAHGQVLEFHAGLRVERSLCAPKLRSAPELASSHRRKILRQTCSLPKGVGEVGKSNEGEEGGKERGKEDCYVAPRCREGFDGQRKQNATTKTINRCVSLIHCFLHYPHQNYPFTLCLCRLEETRRLHCRLFSLLEMRQLFWPFALVAVVPFMPFRATAHFMAAERESGRAGEPFLLACYHAPAD